MQCSNHLHPELDSAVGNGINMVRSNNTGGKRDTEINFLTPSRPLGFPSWAKTSASNDRRTNIDRESKVKRRESILKS